MVGLLICEVNMYVYLQTLVSGHILCVFVLIGLMWNKIPTNFDNWEVEIAFKVSGRGRVGADGLVCT